ncbi:uncharacterized protein METZ01_LOCUS39608, partial [marine metagenome]
VDVQRWGIIHNGSPALRGGEKSRQRLMNLKLSKNSFNHSSTPLRKSAQGSAFRATQTIIKLTVSAAKMVF